jgi:hypothetical protein
VVGLMKTDMGSGKRGEVYSVLESMLEEGALPHGAKAIVAAQFAVDASTISRIWARGQRTALESANGIADVRSRKKNSGRRSLYNPVQLKQALKQVPTKRRKSIRDAAAALRIGSTTFHRMVKKKKYFRPASLAVKPSLTVQHCTNRTEFVRGKVRAEDRHYDPQYQTIHIDEKWFNQLPVTERCYLAEDEEDPVCETRHKSHIPKIMFLCALGRPRRERDNVGYVGSAEGEYNADEIDVLVDTIDEVRDDERETARGNWYWDGKVGCWPIVNYRAALRNSRNRPRGTIEPHPLSMNGAVYKDFIINKVLPSIALNCPVEMKRRTIIIQQDNAPPHRALTNDSQVFKDKCAELRIDCRLEFQPAQSPDMNLCDLSFFPAIQALYYKMRGIRNLDGVIAAVYRAFNIYDPAKINRGFLSLFMNYNCCLQNDGTNKYKMPHMHKRKLERLGRLPVTIRSVYGLEVDDAVGELEARILDIENDDD